MLESLTVTSAIGLAMFAGAAGYLSFSSLLPKDERTLVVDRIAILTLAVGISMVLISFLLRPGLV